MLGRANGGRTGTTISVLQAGCAGLATAAILAAGQVRTTAGTHDGVVVTATDPVTSVPSEWVRTGPLAVPSIGVVPPGLEDWFQPGAAPSATAAGTSRRGGLVAGPSTQESLRVDEDPVEPTPENPFTPAPEEPVEDPVVPPATTPSEQPAQLGSTTPPASSTTPTSTTQTSTTPTSTSSSTAMPTGATQPSTSAPPDDTEQPPPPPPPPPPPTEEPPPEPPVLTLGEPFTVTDATGGAVFTMTIDAVTLDPACTGPAPTPAVHGHLVALQLRVTTGSDLSTIGGPPAVEPSAFGFAGPDGVAVADVATGSAAACLPEGETFPSGPLAADQQLAGTVVLDVPADAGTITFAPAYLSSAPRWSFDATPDPPA